LSAIPLCANVVTLIMSASLSLYDKEQAAREKYIYFLCGVAGPLFAYLGKDYKPSHPRTTQDTLAVSTLSCFVALFLFGTERIIFYIQGIGTNIEALTAREETGNCVDALTTRMQKAQKGVLISINNETGKAFTTEEIQAAIEESAATAEKHLARIKKWLSLNGLPWFLPCVSDCGIRSDDLG
jgi:hypothetical protein